MNRKTFPFSDLITLTRPTPRWVWGPAGKLVEVPAGEPAYEYDSATGAAMGLRIDSSTVTNFWTNSHAIPVAGSNTYFEYHEAPGIFPDAVQMGRYIKRLSPGIPPMHAIDVAGPLASHPVIRVCCVFEVLTTSDDPIMLTIYGANPAGTVANVVVNPVTGAVGGTNLTKFVDYGATLLSESGPNGGRLWELYCAFTADSLGLADGRTATANFYLPNTENGEWVWHHSQVVDSDYATSYIPTDGSAVTVGADDCRLVNPVGFSGVGAFVMEWYAPVDALPSDPATADYFLRGTDALGSAVPAYLYAIRRPTGPSQASLNSYDGTKLLRSYSPDYTQPIKSCIAWDGTTMKRSDNGGAVISSAHNGNLSLTTGISLLSTAIGHVRSLKYVASTEIPTDAKIQELAS